MGKIVVFLFDGITDYEITFVTHLLKADAGMDVITVSYDGSFITGKSGLTYKVDKQLKDIDISEVDGLIIGGGWYGEFREEMYNLITHLNSSNKLLAGICGAGTYFLAKTGVLENVRYTTPITKWTDKHIGCFGNKDPFPRDNYIDERVVKDKNVITAIGPAFVEFGIKICDWFNLFKDDIEKEEFARLYSKF